MAAVTASWMRGAAWLSLAVALILCVLPLLGLVIALSGGDWSISHPVLRSLPSTLVVTGTAALGAALIGVLLGHACAQFPGRAPMMLTLALSVTALLPTYILAIGWSVWLLPALPLGTGSAASFTEGVLPTVWVWIAAHFPIPLWATLLATRHWNVAWTEAAAANGAGKLPRLRLRARHVTPPLASAFLLVWILLLSDFAVPDYYRIPTFATEVFVEVASYGNVRGALLAGLPFLLLSLIAMLGISRLWSRWRTVSEIARTRPSQGIRGANRAIAAIAVAVGVLLFCVLPLTAIFLTIGNIQRFLEVWPAVWPDAALSGGIALASSVLGVTVTLFLAYAGQRNMISHAGTVRAALVASFAVPSAILGLAGIALWNQPGPVGAVLGSGAALILFMAARWLPLAHELQWASFRAMPESLEEAAMAHGASFGTSFRKIVLRSSAPSLATLSILIFILAFNDVTLAALLAPPGWSTLPLRVFSTVHYGSAPTLAAISAWHLVFLTVPLIGVALLGGRLVRTAEDSRRA